MIDIDDYKKNDDDTGFNMMSSQNISWLIVERMLWLRFPLKINNNLTYESKWTSTLLAKLMK